MASQEYTFKYELSKGYTLAVADGATVNSKGDNIGVTIQINFTRVDTSPQSETIPAEIGAEGFKQVGPPMFDSPVRKYIECAVLLRPDHAFQVANAILTNLARLNDDVRKRYNLPKIHKPETAR